MQSKLSADIHIFPLCLSYAGIYLSLFSVDFNSFVILSFLSRLLDPVTVLVFSAFFVYLPNLTRC